MKFWLAALVAAVFVSAAACGGGDDSPTSTGSPGGSSIASPTLSPLEASLASVTLRQEDLPDGLEGFAPDFATNEEVAGSDANQLATLVSLGRQLGVDVQYIPTDRLDPSSPIRGGIQSSASVYTQPFGASQSFQETAAQARENNWQANYPSITDLAVTEVPQVIGDESVWIRLTGTAECTFVETPAPGSSPTPTCGDTKLLIVDNLVFRTGRVRGYLQVSTLFPPSSPTDSFVSQVSAWANLMVTRAGEAFPS